MGVSPPRFSMPSEKPTHLFAKSRLDFQIGFSPENTALLITCAHKVLPAKASWRSSAEPLSWHQSEIFHADLLEKKYFERVN
ncbi:hypothetical protein ACN38_g8099 [Penicillium nordicum]|uniref:Uncharacterized protein n=1 Tax=Penicillium nordicum TaxID=229535 RepID=A0A0M8NXR5_9EURO|nr:hypothetical protein ACN38_g8099 [Penicillium nordicum]